MKPRFLPTWLTLSLFVGTMAYAVAEDVTLVTYYPSPRAAYKELYASALEVLLPGGNLQVPGSVSVGPTYTPGAAGSLLVEGNVGIGTTSPVAELEIQGGPGSSIPLLALVADPTHTGHLMEFTTTDGTVFAMTKEGNFGLGTDSPQDFDGVGTGRTLHIEGGSNPSTSLTLSLRGSGGAITGGMVIRNLGGSPLIILGGRTAGVPVSLIAENTEHLRLAPDGHVGVGDFGAASPSERLHLLRDDADVALRLRDPGDASYVMGIDRSDGTKFKLQPANSLGQAGQPVGLVLTPQGNLGLGTASPQTPAPNGAATGNLTANDVYLSSVSRWMSAPLITYDSASANTTKTLGQHDLCASAGMQFWDSKDDDGVEACRVLWDTGASVWKITGAWMDTPVPVCYAVCLDWQP